MFLIETRLDMWSDALSIIFLLHILLSVVLMKMLSIGSRTQSWKKLE